MDKDFYAIIKLVSGEEIFSKVCPCEEEDRILLILENPIVIEKSYLKKFNLPILKISSWIKLSDEDIFVINMENVITITETNDTHLIEIHEQYSTNKNEKFPNQFKATSNMGYVSSVSDARKSLEKIFNL